jgi:hypothetical protein
VGKLTAFLDTFNSLTGISKRHNKALRDVTDWSVNIQEFLSKYGLKEGGSNLATIFDNIGDAKFDITTITHRARDLINAAKSVKGSRISPLIEEIIDELGNIRRALINPTLGISILRQDIPKLHESFKKLQDVISATEYK